MQNKVKKRHAGVRWPTFGTSGPP